ncbi:hypothetical protein HPB48_007869 [Haemaphysalis longicornis]|uniref:Uncharacterized protein n=1 Tax=Haemaphysalis longicornis TaxID=44386 RepID=A0A9J6FTK3_HAELO|nr:hypothetical protein HPB48_007869 [Haemaphysalis longicornis]
MVSGRFRTEEAARPARSGRCFGSCVISVDCRSSLCRPAPVMMTLQDGSDDTANVTDSSLRMRSDTIDLAGPVSGGGHLGCPQREGQGQVHCPHQDYAVGLPEAGVLCVSAARGVHLAP